MIFNKKKFNIFAGLTLILIAIIVGVSFVGVSVVEGSNTTQVGGVTAEDKDIVGGEVDSEIEDNVSEEGSQEGTGLKKRKSPFKSNWHALSYSLNIFENFNYSVTSSQSVEAGTAGITGVQKIDKEIYSVDGKAYVKAVADGSKVPAGYGENYTEYAIVDSSTIATKREGSNTKSQAILSYTNQYGILPSELPYVLNSETILELSPLKNNPDLSYYVLTATLKPGAWVDYLRSIETSGGEGSNPDMTSIVLTIKINKTYGVITSIHADEDYNISRAGMRAKADSTVDYSFTYCKDKEYAVAIQNIENSLK